MEKPKIRPETNGHTWHVRFPCGGTAEVFELAEAPDFERFGFDAERSDGRDPNGTVHRRASSLEGAITEAWCAVRPKPPALNLSQLARLGLAESSSFKERNPWIATTTRSF